MVLLATMTTTGAQPGESIFDWNLADAPAESRPASVSPEQDKFREILDDPRSTSETFWDREQRWSEALSGSSADHQSALLKADDSAPSDISWAKSIPVSELSLAVAPLLLAVALLRVRTNATYSRMSYT